MADEPGTYSNLDLGISADVRSFDRELQAKLRTVAAKRGAEFGKTIAEAYARTAIPGVTKATAKAVDAAAQVAEAKKIAVKVSADTSRAFRDLAAIPGELDVKLRADTTAANEEIDHAARDRRSKVKVDADTSDAEQGVNRVGGEASIATLQATNLALALAAIGPVGVPALAAVAGAAVGLGTTLGALAGAAGIAGAAFHGIGDAVGALGEKVNVAGGRVRTATDAALELAQAQQAAASRAASMASAQQGLKSALRGVEDAERRVAEAQRNVRLAQMDLTEARREAIRTLDELRRRTEEGALSEKEANLAVLEARAELDRQMKSSTSTALDRERAQLSLERAELNLRNIAEDNKNLAQERADAQKKGVNGARQVVEAQERVRDAITTQRDAQRSLADSQAKVAEAQKRIAQTAASNALSMRIQALQAAKARESMTGTTTQAKKLDEAMARLGPRGREFARYLHSTWVPLFKRLKIAAEDAFLPSVQSALARMEGLEGPLTKFVTNVGTAMSDVVADAVTALQGPEFTRLFDYIQRETPNIIRQFGQIAIDIGRIMANVMVAAGPAGQQLLGDMADVLQRIADWTSSPAGQQKLTEFFSNTVPVIEALARLAFQLLRTVGILMQSEGFQSFVEGMTAGVSALNDFMQANPKAVEVALWGIFGALAAIRALQFGKSIGSAVGGIGKLGKAAGKGLGRTGKGFAKGGAKVAGKLGKGGLVGAAAGLVGGIAGGAIADGRGGARDVGGNALAYGAQGAGIGALIGSFFGPGVGTAIGAAIGGLAGAIFGAWKALGTDTIVGFFEGTLEKVTEFGSKVWGWIDEKVIQPIWTVVRPAIGGLGTAFTWVWRSIVQPVFKGIGTVVTWLYREIVKPYFTLIRVWIDVVWAAIQVAFGLGQIAIKAAAEVIKWLWRSVVKPYLGWVGDKFKWLWEKIVSPVMGFIGDKIARVWNKVVKPVLEAFGTFIGKHVAPKFKTAVEGLGKIWEGLQDAAKKPISFIIDTVLNNGLLAAYNWLAKKFNVKPDDVRVNNPFAAKPRGRGGGGTRMMLADGGPVAGPGTGTSDSIPAMLSNGEYVVRASAAKQNRSLLDAINSGRRRGTGDLWDAARDRASDVYKGTKSLLSNLTDPGGSLGKIVEKLLGTMPGKDSLIAKLAMAVPRKILGGMTQALSFLDIAPNQPGGGPYSGPGLGWQRMWGMVNSAFPWAKLHSAFRPGAITATGRQSMHALGRAIDITPDARIFSWIAKTFPNSRELIFSPMGNRQLYRGRPHMYTGVTRADHWDHIHWGYDRGGILPPGDTLVRNRTGQPEAILNPQQWRAVMNIADRGVGPTVNHWSVTAGSGEEAARLVERQQRRREAFRRMTQAAV